MKSEVFKNMVKDELQKLLQDHGLSEKYTLDLLEETIKMAQDKKDVSNLLRAVENLQDMHGMKDKHLLKTTQQIEATSSTKLIDELREEEQHLIATKTTVEEIKDETETDNDTRDTDNAGQSDIEESATRDTDGDHRE